MRKFFLLSLFVLLNCKLENNEIITINASVSSYEYNIGNDHGFILLKTQEPESRLNETDLDENTKFEIQLIAENAGNIYNAECRLWKGASNLINVICDLKGGLKTNETINNLIEKSFDYEQYTIIVNIKIENLKLKKIEGNLPFLYSNQQMINITENQEKVELYFKYLSYNNEPLVLFDNYPKGGLERIIRLEKCQKIEKRLKCEVPRENLDAISRNQNSFILLYISELVGFYSFPLVDFININYMDIKKEDIYFKLEKITETPIDLYTYVTFSTNITDINIIKSASFKINLTSDVSTYCSFIKHDTSDPLYISCIANKEINITLGNIVGFNLTDLHYKYNFILGPGRNDDPINIIGPKRTNIFYVFPETLDFSSTDSLNIIILAEKVDRLSGLKLNPDGEELVCQDISYLKKCTVPKNHFKKGGYYYIQHKNNMNKYSIDYGTFGVKVNLPEDEKVITINASILNSEYYIGNDHGFILLKTKEPESRLNETDLDENTKFEIQLTAENTSNIYNAECRLWRGESNLINVICDLKGGLKTNETINNLIEKSFVYKQYTIKVNIKIENLKLIKIEGNLPFLYSNQQMINITENQEKAELYFKYLSYNNEPLVLFDNYPKGGLERIIRLENCQKEEKRLKCEVQRENLDAISRKENSFIVLYISELVGFYSFPLVDFININYKDIKKEDIYFKLEAITETPIDLYNYVTFSTNITDINKIKSASFKINLTSDVSTYCSFIKHDNSEPLYISCIANKEINITIGNIVGFNLTDLHYKYNFILGPERNDDPINIIGPKRTNIFYVFPETLDFSLTDLLDIIILAEKVDRLSGLKLNPDGDELVCQDISYLKKCTVPKNHFKKGGYYYIQHKNNMNKYSIDYGTFGVKVSNIPPGNEEKNNNKKTKYSLVLLLLLCFLL